MRFESTKDNCNKSVGSEEREIKKTLEEMAFSLSLNSCRLGRREFPAAEIM